jgi:hypothetical protein
LAAAVCVLDGVSTLTGLANDRHVFQGHPVMATIGVIIGVLPSRPSTSADVHFWRRYEEFSPPLSPMVLESWRPVRSAALTLVATPDCSWQQVASERRNRNDSFEVEAS